MDISVLNTTIYIAIVQIFNIIFSHAKNGAYPCSSFHTTDPDWNLQWSLKGHARVPVGMNVMHAWKQCYNGSGVTVAIVDDGLYDHPDLNINRALNADINATIPASRSHGTQIAGVVAAKRNSKCGIGIAFEATLADIRIITGLSQPASKIRQILTSHLDKIDIYSNSYTNPSLWALVHNTVEEVLEAVRTGTSQGRNGKGAIYVWSTGNGGAPPYPFGCAYESLNNNPYVIPVAGIRWNYNKLTSGDSCSAIMVAAFSRQREDQDYRIVTASGKNGCEHYFGRNSAAVAVVSGAIALALQANPTLSYRDIMHLLVNTSNADLDFNPYDFITNHAGIKVSKTFGFGLLDIGRLVDMAKVWENVKPRIMCNCWSNISFSLRSSDTVMVENCKITSLEHVEIYFNVESRRAGQLRLDLKSPNGTVSNMIPGRQLDQRQSLNLTVTSVHFWGEASTGIWTLYPSGFSNNSELINGRMLEWQLKLYGFNENTMHTPPLTAKVYVSTTSVYDLCYQDSERGPCTDYKVMWFYDREKARCRRFWYGGCDGNANRFETVDECNTTCILRRQPATGTFNCNFESNTCGWTQATDDKFDWTRHSGSTESGNTGPSYDHTTERGYYMYIETSYTQLNDTARLQSPTVTPSYQARCLKFWYHMYGAHINKLNVYLRDGAKLGSPVWTRRRGTRKSKWKQATIDISRTSQFQVIFEGVRGDHYEGDIAIDDISLVTGNCQVRKLLRDPNLPMVDCEVSEWSNWSLCSVTCGLGFKTKNRTVIAIPENGGKRCPRKMSRKRKCKAAKCPIDCEIEEWASWSACLKTCGEDAVQERRRKVRRRPKHGGMDCPPRKEKRFCKLGPCQDTAAIEKIRRDALYSNPSMFP